MSAKTSRKPRIALIGLGGTIASMARDSLDSVDYPDFGTKLQPDELLDRVPEIAGEADVRPVPFRSVGSYKIGPKDWLELVGRIHTAAAEEPPPDGIVLTHGTATLEETAYFLNLTLKTEVPVVIVGSQRPPNTVSSDAALNLLNAVRVAASPAARGLGVLTLLNDEIQAAREVTKTSTFRLEAFQTPDLGMLGYADADGEVAIYRRPTRRHAPATEFDVDGLDDLPRVDITYSYAGMDGTAARAAVAAGARGIVSASLAPGLFAEGEKDALLEARRQGVVVVQSSRVLSGRVLDRVWLNEHGILTADNLNPQKARVLVMLALSVTEDLDEIRRMFREY